MWAGGLRARIPFGCLPKSSCQPPSCALSVRRFGQQRAQTMGQTAPGCDCCNGAGSKAPNPFSKRGVGERPFEFQ